MVNISGILISAIHSDEVAVSQVCWHEENEISCLKIVLLLCEGGFCCEITCKNFSELCRAGYDNHLFDSHKNTTGILKKKTIKEAENVVPILMNQNEIRNSLVYFFGLVLEKSYSPFFFWYIEYEKNKGNFKIIFDKVSLECMEP